MTTASTGRGTGAESSDDATAMLRDTLWSGAPAGTETATYLLLPGGSRVQAMLPAARCHRRAAAAAFKRRTNQTSVREVVARGALAGAARVGILQPALRRRVVLPAGSGGAVAGAICARFGRDDLVFLGGLGRPRPNQKPVVQVLEPGGRTLAWAKIGWNELTRGLVDHEHATVERFFGRSPLLALPEPLHREVLGDLVVVLLGPLPLWSADPRSRRAPSPDELRAIAALGGDTRRATLDDSTYATDLRTRARAADADIATRVDAVLDRCSRRGREWEFGTFHGDFVPWNVYAGPSQLCVWDWERSRDDVPVGFDSVHYTLQRASGGNPARLAESLGLRDRIASSLSAAGVDPDAHGALVALYLAELLVRFGNDQAETEFEGLGAISSAYIKALDAHLESWSGS